MQDIDIETAGVGAATAHTVFTVRLPKALHDEAADFAKDMDRSLSWVVRTALRAYINEESK